MIIPIFALLVVPAKMLYAGEGGSIYSTIGIGDLRYLPGVRSEGMGYTGIGLPGSGYINPMSPATWARINRTRFEGSFLYEGYHTTDGTISRYLARGDFGGAMLALPISQANGIVFGAGFVPYSTVNYDLYTYGSSPLSIDTLAYRLHQTGSGSIGKGLAGLSYEPFSGLAIGASLNYMFGTINRSLTMDATQGAFASGTFTDAFRVHGVTYTASLLYTGFGDFSAALRPLALGIIATTRGNIRIARQTEYTFAAEFDTSGEVTGRLFIPMSWGIGLAYQAGERYILAADYFAQPWSSASLDGQPFVDVRDAYRFGVGVEWLPSKDINARWLERFSYRLGFSYNGTYYEVNGNPINEWAVTAGFAMPLSGETRANVSFEYGRRGMTGSGLIADTIFRMNVSLNIAELWFVRYEED
jgi:hypothetical protein